VLLTFFGGCLLEHWTAGFPFSLISLLLSLIPPGERRDNILEYVMNASFHILVRLSFTSFLSFHLTLLGYLVRYIAIQNSRSFVKLFIHCRIHTL
jgi:hypothetical protein